MNKEKVDGKRVLYLDALRVVSTIGVIVLHTAAGNFKKVPIDSFAWHTFNIFDSLVRFCVPVFVMISGALFLDPEREVPTKRLFTKNIMRITTAYIFWSFIYVVFPKLPALIISREISFDGFWRSFIFGYSHLWFMFMIFGLYLATPILRKITTDKKTVEYFLILSFLFTFVLNLLKLIPKISDDVGQIAEKIGLDVVSGYSGYFVLGYYLQLIDFSEKKRKIIYGLGILGTIATIAGTAVWSMYTDEAIGKLYDYLMPNVYLQSVAVFIFFKYRISKINWRDREIKVITELSKLSFGIYLSHELVNIVLKRLDITTLSYNPVLAVICNSLIVFFVSLTATYILNKIPYVNKYLI